MMCAVVHGWASAVRRSTWVLDVLGGCWSKMLLCRHDVPAVPYSNRHLSSHCRDVAARVASEEDGGGAELALFVDIVLRWLLAFAGGILCHCCTDVWAMRLALG